MPKLFGAAKGDTGATGAAGATGATGATGAAGAAGTIGGMVTIIPPMYTASIAGTWSMIQASDQYMAGILNNFTSGTDLDEVNYRCYLAAGTYTVTAILFTGTDRGIMKLKLASTTICTIDTYAAGNASNVLKVVTGCTVAASGLYTLRLMIDGKNGASSGYLFSINALALQQTA